MGYHGTIDYNMDIDIDIDYNSFWGDKKNNNNIGRFPGGGLGNQNPARTIAHSPPGVKETLSYMLREKQQGKQI